MNPILTKPTLAELRQLRDEIIRIAHEHGASNVRVFGSLLHGDSHELSDIDLLIDQDWSRLSAWGGMALVVALEEAIGYPVDITTPEELNPLIRDRVLREAIPL
ncbi:MAG: nucleotidyltransferase domain-containing protein [Anaerolineae bacterium]|nr:nucleotidyltransferase domain-containing protein [Anaerolineae bacterium]